MGLFKKRAGGGDDEEPTKKPKNDATEGVGPAGGDYDKDDELGLKRTGHDKAEDIEGEGALR